MSSLILPLRGQTAETGTRPAGGLLFPIRLGTGTGSVQQRETEVVKAVAAAVAVSHTGPALQIATKVLTGEDNPGELFDEVVKVKGDLETVVSEVRRVQGNRSGAAGPDEEQRVVAAAIGADAVLVAAGHAKVKGDDNVARAALMWVAAVDAALLQKAARAAARREFLNPGQAQDDVKRLGERLDALVKSNEDAFKAISERLEALEKGGGGGGKSRT